MNSIISMSSLTMLNFTTLPPSEFEQVTACWISTAGVALKIRKFKVHNSHNLQQVLHGSPLDNASS